MNTIKNIFLCNNVLNSRHSYKSVSKISNINKEKRICSNSQIEKMNSIKYVLDRVKITFQKKYYYIIPIDWFEKLLLYINDPSSKNSPGEMKDILYNKETNVCLMIYEAYKEIVNCFNTEFVYFVIIDDDDFLFDENNNLILDLSKIRKIKFIDFKNLKVRRSIDESTGNNVKFCYTKGILIDKNNKNKDLCNSKQIPPVYTYNNGRDSIFETKYNTNSQKESINSPIKKSNIKNSLSNKNNMETSILPIINDNKNLDNHLFISNSKNKYNENSDFSESSYLNTKGSFNFSSLGKNHLQPKGLYNGSVYCFMNTGMQCLASIPELNYYFLNQSYKNITKTKNLDYCKSLYEFMESYKNLGSSLKAPNSLYNACHSILQPNRQHDCQEFLRRFLGKIQDEINGKTKYNFEGAKNFLAAWNIYIEKNFSIIDYLFTGMFKSCVICKKCKHSSGKYCSLYFIFYYFNRDL